MNGSRTLTLGDLAIRAARRLAVRARSDCPGVAIEVQKRIPMQGGVGGGSSDAATVLVALNELWDLGLKSVELTAIGAELGADVPVFVHGRAAWAEGMPSSSAGAEPEWW